MNKLEYLKDILGYLDNPDPESLRMSMDNVHHKGVFSLVINGTEHGRLTRVFIATEDIPSFEVQLHTHRYPITITSIKGEIMHHEADILEEREYGSVQMSRFEYRSPLNGGKGLKFLDDVWVKLKDYALPIGGSVRMGITEFHTMSCKAGAMWIVQENGFMIDNSWVLGVPFVLDDLYTEPKSFQINDMVQKVRREVKKIVLNYELV